ncbi:MAG: hypothetical protein IT363_00770 [Methanoregulaceae archaeon]|nr:hypothetical protein [Methanoregulaceae archaeon]
MNIKSIQLCCAVLIGTAIALSLMAFQGMQPTRVYDIAAARGKLTSIGEKLQVYRKTHRPLPVSERTNFRDAGLPEMLLELAKPGNPWSLADGEATFRVKSPNELYDGTPNHFAQMYWSRETASQIRKQDMGQWFAIRGEELPILVDYNPSSGAQIAGESGYTVLVLRLSGKVEKIEVKDHAKPVWQW